LLRKLIYAKGCPKEIDLGTLGGSGSAAFAVSPSGLVVGHSLTAGDAEVHAVLWSLH